MIEPTTDQIVEVLHNARALIARPWGWTKRRYSRPARNGGTAYCAIGALHRAFGGNSTQIPTAHADEYWAARTALAQALPDPHLSMVSEFNDSPTTKKKDVLAVYDRAIEIVKNGA